MSGMPDFVRRAIEAQGKVSPDEVMARLDRDAQVIPPDDAEVTRQQSQVVAPPVEVEQASLLDMEIRPIRYESLLPAEDVATYKRVKRWTMALATDAREILAEITGGTIGDGGRSKKEFLQTKIGRYRVCMSYNSDNTTETAAHERMGVKTIHLSEPAEVLGFFRDHGVAEQEAYHLLVRKLQGRFRT